MSPKNNKEILNEIRHIQKDKKNWKNNIDYLSDYIDEIYSTDVKSKALWVLGEMGLKHPTHIKEYVDKIAKFTDSNQAKLRERSINALGRIGRADKNLILPHLEKLMKTRNDQNESVRLSFVWACENIATNAPELFYEELEIFFDMISDSSEKVRMEAPEMFRVIGKRKPEYVKPYLKKLEYIAQNNKHPIVRIHCEGAIRITKNALKK